MADFCQKLEMSRSAKIGLANRWFQPLTHVSDGGFARVSAACGQDAARETRGEQRFRVARFAAHSVPQVFA